MSQKEVAREAGAAATGAESVAIAGVEEERRRLREVQEELAGLEGAGEEIATSEACWACGCKISESP